VVTGIRSASIVARSYPKTYWSRNAVMPAMRVSSRTETVVEGWSGHAAGVAGVGGLVRAQVVDVLPGDGTQ